MADNIPPYAFTTQEDWYGELTFFSAEDGSKLSLSGRQFIMLITPATTGATLVEPVLTLTMEQNGGLSLKAGDDATIVFRVDRGVARGFPQRGEFTADILELVAGSRYVFMPVRIQYLEPAGMRAFISRTAGAKVSFSSRQQPVYTPVAVAGREGKPGSAITVGTSPPANTMGRDGDFYIQDRNGETPPGGRIMFGPKANGAWPSSGWVIQSLGNDVVPFAADPKPAEVTPGQALFAEDRDGVATVFANISGILRDLIGDTNNAFPMKSLPNCHAVTTGVPTLYSDEAMDDAIRIAKRLGKMVMLPPGRILLNGGFKTAGFTTQVLGSTAGGTIVFYDGHGKFIDIDNPDPFQQTVFKDFDVVPCSLTGEAAMAGDILYPELTVFVETQLIISNVRFRHGFGSPIAGSSQWSKSWNSGLRIGNIQNEYIVDVSIVTKDDLKNSAGKTVGRSDGSFIIEVYGGRYNVCHNWTNFRGWYADIGYKGSAYLEGLRADSVDFVGVRRGYYLPDTTPKGGFFQAVRSASWWFTNSHVAAFDTAFDADSIFDVHGTLNIQRYYSDDETDTSVGLRLVDPRGVRLKGSSATDFNVFLEMAGGDSNDIDYHLDSCNSGFVIAGTVSKSKITISANGADDDAALDACINLSPTTVTERRYNDGSSIIERGGVGHRYSRTSNGDPLIEAWAYDMGRALGLELGAQGKGAVALINALGPLLFALPPPGADAISSWPTLQAGGGSQVPKIYPEGPADDIGLVVAQKGAGPLVLGSGPGAPLGFYGAIGRTRATISGSRADSTTFGRLMQVLAEMNFVVDATTAPSVTPVIDTDYAILTSDRQVGGFPFSKTITLTLPAASSFPYAEDLVIYDLSGSAGANRIDIVTATSGDIIGGAAGGKISLSSPYQSVTLRRGSDTVWLVVA